MLLEATTARGRRCLLPPGDVLEAIAAAARPGLALEGLLSVRPFFLTAALVAFHDSRLRPAGSPSELVEWLKLAWLPELMAGRPIRDWRGQWTGLRRASRKVGPGQPAVASDDSPRRKADAISRIIHRCLRAIVPAEGKRARRELAACMLADRFAQSLVVGGRSGDAVPFWLAQPPAMTDGSPAGIWEQTCRALAGQAMADAAFAGRLLDEKLASLRQFAYGASHEINNPLANIAMRAEALLRGETDESRARSLRTIHQQALRAHQMITDLMLFAHPPALRPRNVQPAEVVARVVGEVLARRPQRGFAVVLEQACQPLFWRLDPDQFAELVLALVNNAVEAVAGTGEIRLQVETPSGNELVLRCHDSGPGFDERIARHLFDPFFSGREAGRGLGFGLSRAWTIAQSHGGSLRVVDRSAGRTCFEARFPRSVDGCGFPGSLAPPAGARHSEAA